jgi:uncharacterized protein with ParB-like and HNH nuclease domain
VRRVLASVSLAYPIGAVMMLQQGNHQIQFKPRLVDSVTLPEPQPPNLLILDGQQRLTTLFMVLLSGQPVVIKDQKSQKLIKKWYYLDIEKCLNPHSDRREAIVAVPESKKLQTSNGVIDVSTPMPRKFSRTVPPVKSLLVFGMEKQVF